MNVWEKSYDGREDRERAAPRSHYRRGRGKWEIRGLPGMMKMCWKLLELMPEDLEMITMRMDPELQGKQETLQALMISPAKKLIRDMNKLNKTMRDKRKKKEI